MQQYSRTKWELCFGIAKVCDHSVCFLRRPYADTFLYELNGCASYMSRPRPMHVCADDGLKSVMYRRYQAMAGTKLPKSVS